MRILNRKNIEIKDPDLSKGYLTPDSLFLRHHEAVEAVAEQGHWVTVKEYPNGGKDVEFVIDTPAVEAKDAWDEYEEVLRFVEYTEAELAARRIDELKQLLKDSDYNILKVVEGATTMQACEEIIKKRAEWRKEINELEKHIKK